ncbi:amine oxidase catalytic domain-containing protein [Marasmius fiardii PR-910]|nr:amine oxidase catalytic domain-containing protein [Marasmius fiardii PR-910]
MIPGYDCPQEAVYLPSTVRSASGSKIVQNAICVFELDTGRSISRHTAVSEDNIYGAVKGYVLTVRSIATVGNYDYRALDLINDHYPHFDYMFHLDGTVKVQVSASGYLQTSYWDPQQKDYGGRIWNTTLANVHDHIINFKVDFDIAGIENSLLETTTHQEEVEHPWLDDDWGTTTIQQRISRRFVQNENDALLKYPVNLQGGYAIVNADKQNAWGSPRGYAIHPGYNPVHTTIVGSKRVLENANWARYNLAVSKRKETEPSSSSMWNLQMPADPAVNFHKFFDGEDIYQEDLVAWVNLGMHHLPSAEDSPNTRTNFAISSVLLAPLNYFDSDVSLESMNAIVLEPSEDAGEPFKFNDYGVKQDLTCIPHASPPFQYIAPQTYGIDGNKL